MKDQNRHHGKRFIRTGKSTKSFRALHNIRRWEWIGEAGMDGRTYSEIDAPNSFYRDCCKERPSYTGNSTSIDQDLDYDIEKGMIRAK
jgi:hypothetical protein